MSPISSSPYSELGLALPAAAKEARQQLGQDDFLRLMTTQMKHQDPFKPLDATEFLGQIAQFSTVSGVQSLNESFAGLAGALSSSQALQAAQLVGHGVLVPSAQAPLIEGEGLFGALELAAGGNATVEIVDSSGQRVRTLHLGTQSAGLQHFHWDGLDDAGAAQPPGRYLIRGSINNEAAPTLAVGRVNSVSINGNSVELNLQGMNTAPFGSVRQIF